MITTNNIVDGVVAVLASEYEDIEIHTDEIMQDITTPCFSVTVVNPTITAKLKRKYEREFPICIYYFPASEDEPRPEINEVADNLMDKLEYITVDGDLIRGDQMSYTITSENVMAFLVTYNAIVIRPADKVPYMEHMNIETDSPKPDEPDDGIDYMRKLNPHNRVK